MKTSKKIAMAIGIALGSLVYYATPGSALTWNFTYMSDGTQYNPSAGYGSQSGSFVALGSEVDGTYAITEFQFTHDTLTSYSFDTMTGTSTFMNTVSATNMVTITGGTVSDIDLFVNDSTIPGEGSFEISSAFDQVTLYNTTNGTFGDDIDGSNFSTDITFTPASGAGASWEFSPGPALAIMTVGLGINKLVKMARSRHKDKQK